MSFSVMQRLLAAHGRKLVGMGVMGTAAGIAYARDHNPFEPSFRFFRTTSVATSIAFDFQLSKCENDKECWAQLHSRSAQKLLTLCLRHGGVYVKAGQYMATLTHVLPAEYTQTLSKLQDHAKPSPFGDVVRLFKQEHKRHPNEIFSWFDPNPIAAASLAQVHRATLRHSRKEVAVKIQYPRLHQLFISDLLTMTNVCRSVMYFYPNLDLMWMVDEFRSNLMKELDFSLEGRSAERVAKLFAWRNDVAVPKIFWRWTTAKILVMDYIDGVKVNNVNSLKMLNFDPREVGTIVCDVFAEMIFEHGFVHGDPHPGNILVRPRPGNKSKPQIVLLDHGLYQELSDEFRVDYCELWKACIQLDRNKIREISAKFNVEPYYKFFPLVFTFRALPEEGSLCGKLGDPITKEEVLKQIQGLGVEFNAGGVTESLNKFLSSLPRQMLLILKTQNLVRHINKELGGSTIRRIGSMFDHAVRGVYVETCYRSWWRKLLSNLIAEFNVLRLRLVLLYLEAGARWRDFDWRHLRFRTRLMIG